MIKINAIKNGFICTVTEITATCQSVTLVVTLDRTSEYRNHYSYVLGVNRNGKIGTMFSGDQYSTPYNWSNRKIALDLLSWLTLKPGDTDSEHFDDYTPEQLEWVNSFDNEVVSCIASEAEERMNRRSR